MALHPEAYKRHVHHDLALRQQLFIAISLILLFICIGNVATHRLDPWLAVTGFLLSTCLGMLFSRMFKIHWHEAEEKVVSRLDAFGIALLISYLTLDLIHRRIFEHWLTGASLSAFGLMFFTGLLLGRYLGILQRIHTILRDKEALRRKTEQIN